MRFAVSAFPAIRAAALCSLCALAACGGGANWKPDGVYAPGVDRRAEAEDGIEVGHRLINAGEFELALRAFSRTALDRGETDAEILLGMGTANLGLGRLGQSEQLLQLAIEKEGNWPELWNNLGVVLMEQGRTAEAEQMFRKAYALDNGESDEIRDNLRLSLSQNANSDIPPEEDYKYKLVRRGSGDYLIQPAS